MQSAGFCYRRKKAGEAKLGHRRPSCTRRERFRLNPTVAIAMHVESREAKAVFVVRINPQTWIVGIGAIEPARRWLPRRFREC